MGSKNAISDMVAKLTDAGGVPTLFREPLILGWAGKSTINGSTWFFMLFMMNCVYDVDAEGFYEFACGSNRDTE